MALLALSALLGGADGKGGPAGPSTAPIGVIAARVEALRGLRFTHVPRPQRVTPDQARRDGLRDLERDYPPARRRADEQVLGLLGLIGPGVDLRDVTASLFGQGVAGYYDPGHQAAQDGVGRGDRYPRPGRDRARA